MGKKQFTAHEMRIAVDEIERLKKENAGLRQNVRCLDKQREINKNLVDENVDLSRRLKVAEDALATIANCDTDGIVLNFEETQIVNGHDLAIEDVSAVYKARNALAAIRQEGGAK